MDQLRVKLYNEYITYIENNITVYNIDDNESTALLAHIDSCEYLTDVHKGLIFNILFFLTPEDDTHTQSIILKHIIQTSFKAIKMGSDKEFVLRDIFDKIVHATTTRSTITSKTINFYPQKLFSYIEGVQYENFINLINDYGLYNKGPFINNSGCYTVKNGEVNLKPSGFSGTGLGNFIQQMFSNTQDNHIELPVISDINTRIRFFRNTFDIKIIVDEHSGDGKIVEKDVGFNGDDVPLSSTFTFSQIKEALYNGFNTDSKNNSLSSIYSVFSVFVLKHYNDISPNRAKSESSKDSIKNLMELTKNASNVTSNDEVK
jgi:hypothetical protein